MVNIIKAEDFGIIPDTGKDSAYLVLNVLEKCKEVEDAVLKFLPGRYDFWPDLAFEKQIFISNHDQDIDRRISFPLFNFKNFIIDAGGATFFFHGIITPFIIDSCSNIKIKSLTIDWQIPFVAQGTVVETGKDWFDIKINSSHPYKIENKKLIFIGENCQGECDGMNEFDTKTFGPVAQSGDILNPWREFYLLEAYEQDDKIVRFSGPISRIPEKGNAIVMRWGKRYCPGIFMQDSNDIVLEDIIIHHAGGMGIIAQRTRDITLKSVKVKIPDKSARLYTLLADATHFVYCSGTIKLSDCIFENQLDDACNVHGIYAQINNIISKREIIVRLVHPQQQGIEIIRSGETISFVDNNNLNTYAYAKVHSVQKINREFYKISFCIDIPDEACVGHVIENTDLSPDLIVENCIIRNNRARGILATTRGKVIIRNNSFNVAGAAIKISGDANFWFESGAVKDICIENNIFKRINACNDWGSAVIDIDPEISSVINSSICYHNNIKIKNNDFYVKESRIIYAKSVSNMKFCKNNIKTEMQHKLKTDILKNEEMFQLSGCSNISIELE